MPAPGWMPPTRLSAYWCLLVAAALSSLDYYLDGIVYPFWGVENKLPLIISVVVSLIGWFVMLQSFTATERLQGDKRGIIAYEPAPATMLHKVRGYVHMGPVLYKAMGLGLIPAFVVFVLWMVFGWPAIVGIIATAAALSSVFLIAISFILMRRYRVDRDYRNKKQEI